MQEPTSALIQRAVDIEKAKATTVDGHPRSAAEEQRINEACNRLFQDGDGKIVWDWLRQITVNKVLGWNSTDAELRMQEGMRALVALIDARRVAERTRLQKAQVKS